LTVTALSLAFLGGQTLTAQAAVKDKKIMVYYGAGCDIQSVLGKLESCFPSIILPDCEQPEVNIPGTDMPENNVPETNIPEIDFPEVDTPEADSPEEESPEVDIPETDIPEVDTPETDNPEMNQPGTGTPDNNPGNGPTDTNGEHAFIRQVVELVNVERTKAGLAPLSIDTNVQAAAMVRARECEQLFSHTRPDGSSFATALRQQNISYRSAGENIAWGQRSPQEVVNAWMNSPGHRANIMSFNFTAIGVGYYENANGTDYWCQLFIG